MERQEPKPKQVSVTVDGKILCLPARTTGAYLRAATGLSTECDLYLERPGLAADQLLSDADSIELVDGMMFFSTPRTILMGQVQHRRAPK